jgi:hypothetical protein
MMPMKSPMTMRLAQIFFQFSQVQILSYILGFWILLAHTMCPKRQWFDNLNHVMLVYIYIYIYIYKV